jgi:hypothetical protein
MLPVRRHLVKNAASPRRHLGAVASICTLPSLAQTLLIKYFDAEIRPTLSRPSHQPETENEMIARRISESQLPKPVARAYEGVQSVVARNGHASLEELQGAVEYLLDRVKAARGFHSSRASDPGD